MIFIRADCTLGTGIITGRTAATVEMGDVMVDVIFFMTIAVEWNCPLPVFMSCRYDLKTQYANVFCVFLHFDCQKGQSQETI